MNEIQKGGLRTLRECRKFDLMLVFEIKLSFLEFDILKFKMTLSMGFDNDSRKFLLALRFYYHQSIFFTHSQS